MRSRLTELVDTNVATPVVLKQYKTFVLLVGQRICINYRLCNYNYNYI